MITRRSLLNTAALAPLAAGLSSLIPRLAAVGPRARSMAERFLEDGRHIVDPATGLVSRQMQSNGVHVVDRSIPPVVFERIGDLRELTSIVRFVDGSRWRYAREVERWVLHQ